jgi:hypothetical protein
MIHHSLFFPASFTAFYFKSRPEDNSESESDDNGGDEENIDAKSEEGSVLDEMEKEEAVELSDNLIAKVVDESLVNSSDENRQCVDTVTLLAAEKADSSNSIVRRLSGHTDADLPFSHAIAHTNSQPISFPDILESHHIDNDDGDDDDESLRLRKAKRNPKKICDDIDDLNDSQVENARPNNVEPLDETNEINKTEESHAEADEKLLSKRKKISKNDQYRLLIEAEERLSRLEKVRTCRCP